MFLTSCSHEQITNFFGKKAGNLTYPRQTKHSLKPKYKTGSFENCTTPAKYQRRETDGLQNATSDVIYIACKEIAFKAPKSKIQKTSNVIYGILSQAGGEGPLRRNAIRNTWMSELATKENPNHGAYFVVAGKWNDIKEEFEMFQDMIWIDQAEVYNGARSVLPLKTLSFFAVAHIFANDLNDGGWKYAMKVDDDSYVNVRKILQHIQELDEKDSNCFGLVNTRAVKPDREPGHKWSVSLIMYPESQFPLNPVGAGFGVSRNFVKDAFEEGHFMSFRPMAFEDVAIGMLAERTGYYSPKHIKGFVRDDMGRKYRKWKVKCMLESIDMHSCFNDVDVGIDGNFTMIQHHVDADDFKIIHQIVRRRQVNLGWPTKAELIV